MEVSRLVWQFRHDGLTCSSDCHAEAESGALAMVVTGDGDLSGNMPPHTLAAILAGVFPPSFEEPGVVVVVPPGIEH